MVRILAARAFLCMGAGMRPRNKYGNRKTEVDGIVFHSKKEARRYGQLRFLEKGKKITGLACQPSFDLIVGGVKIAKYVGDFIYFEDDQCVVEDVKGFETPVFKIKWALARALFRSIEWRLT